MSRTTSTGGGQKMQTENDAMISIDLHTSFEKPTVWVAADGQGAIDSGVGEDGVGCHRSVLWIENISQTALRKTFH